VPIEVGNRMTICLSRDRSSRRDATAGCTPEKGQKITRRMNLYLSKWKTVMDLQIQDRVAIITGASLWDSVLETAKLVSPRRGQVATDRNVAQTQIGQTCRAN